MLWVFGHYKYFTLSARGWSLDVKIWRQNQTSIVNPLTEVKHPHFDRILTLSPSIGKVRIKKALHRFNVRLVPPSATMGQH